MAQPTQADVSPDKNHTGVVTPTSDVDSVITALLGLLATEDLDPITQAEAYRDALDRTGLTQRELATCIWSGEADVSKLLKLLEAPEDVREQVRTGAMSINAAYRLVRRPRGASGLLPDELLDRARQRAREGRNESLKEFIVRAVRREIAEPSCELCTAPSIGGGRWCQRHFGGAQKGGRRR